MQVDLPQPTLAQGHDLAADSGQLLIGRPLARGNAQDGIDAESVGFMPGRRAAIEADQRSEGCRQSVSGLGKPVIGAQRAVEKHQHAERAAVHHARAAQGLLRRRGFPHHQRETCQQRGHGLGRKPGFRREHRQHGPWLGHRNRLARAAGRGHAAFGETGARGSVEQSTDKGARDVARVPARRHEQPLGDGGVRRGTVAQGRQAQHQVAPGVSIGNREHVDAVEHLGPGRNARTAGNQRLAQLPAGASVSRHHHRRQGRA